MATTTLSVRLYNTLTRAKEELRPLNDGIVRIYSCGPTVYRYVHVGNLRTFMLPDLLCRSLEYLGYRTEQVMNITDVGHLTDDTFDRGEDKMLVSAQLENRSPAEIAAYYTTAFLDDAAKLNIRGAARYPRATEHIPQMIDLISKLIARGHAYEVGGTVYYDIASFPAYGKLSRNSPAKLLAGTRGEVAPRKRHPGDFTLWKGAGERRLRPILMTALATIAGMIPLSLAIGAGSQMLQPLAIAVIGGLLASMIVSLIVTPAVHFLLSSHG